MELTVFFFDYCLLTGGHPKPGRCRLRTSRSGVPGYPSILSWSSLHAAVSLNIEFWKLDIQKRGNRCSRVELGWDKLN